jgi:hypothetical protein
MFMSRQLRNFAINIWACRQKHGTVPPDNFGAYVLLASNFIVVIINHHYLPVYNTLVRVNPSLVPFLSGFHGSVWGTCWGWRYRFCNKDTGGFGGLGVAFSTQVRGFKPGKSRRIFQGEKILNTTSFGGEVKPYVPCRRFAACKRSLK